MAKEDEYDLERLVGGMSLKNLADNVNGEVIKGPTISLNPEIKTPSFEKPADRQSEQ